MTVIFYGRDLFTRGFWDTENKAPMFILFPIFFGLCALISFVPAWIVVLFYRKKLKG